MAGGASKACAVYKKYREITHIIAAITGVGLGVSAGSVFIGKYHNYHVGVWAFVSAVSALKFLRLVFSTRRARKRGLTIPPERFQIYLALGIIGILGGIVGMITYGVLGAQSHEKGFDPEGYYLVIVWAFMTSKWSFFTVLKARKLYKQYSNPEDRAMIVNT